jgi:RHS repeat-associated protein
LNFPRNKLQKLLLQGAFMKPAKLLCLSAFMFVFSNLLLAQTAPNLENGWKPYGSYDGTRLDTVNLMNGNLMLHAPVIPDLPQRGALSITNTLFVSSKDWQVACAANSGSPSGQTCSWQKGGAGVNIQRSPFLGVHRTVVKNGSGTGTVTYSAYGYTVSSADAAAHQLTPVSGTEDPTGEATEFNSLDLTGYHVQMTNPDVNGIFNNVVVTDRGGNLYQGTFAAYSGCSHPVGNMLPRTGGWAAVVDDAPFGDQFCSQGAVATLITDSNGNQMALHGPQNSNPGADTLNRAIPLETGAAVSDYSNCVSRFPIARAFALNYQAPDGTQRQLKECFAEIPIQTSFNQSINGVPVIEAVTGDLSTTHFVPIVTLVLADGTRWIFDYDSYGELISVGLPTGGSITYTWTTIGLTNCSINNLTPVSRAVASRTLNDGQGHSSTWNYHWGAFASPILTNSVTDPLGNDTVHVFTAQAVGGGSSSCDLYETTTTEYQGASSANQSRRRVDTTYSSQFLAADTAPVGLALGNIRPTTIQTTMYPSGKVKLVSKQYDSGLGAGLPIFGNVVKELEYDWDQGAPGALLHETDTVYQWQKNSAYLTARMLDLPASTVVIDPAAANNTKSNCPINATGGTASCIAETDYSYDEPAYLNTPTPAVATQHVAQPNGVRGNQTTVSRWLNTTNSFVTSYTNWYDTGEPFQKIDPLGHTTTLSYDPAYVGGYVTQTCSPQTGLVAHCVSGTYDFTTGVLTSLTNENATAQSSGNTPGDQAHTGNYAYDYMFRLTSAQAPPDPANGSSRAQTSFTFSAPNTFPVNVQRTKSITTALNDSATSFFDGLGRANQTQHVLPGGTATVDTTFDVTGRVATVSNPYFATTDPTYGITTSQYDVLDRVIQTTKQDGSISTVSYDQAAPGVQGICTTSVDEAGKLRRGCSDALGRLIEVDEPNQAATATYAQASVTVGGSEQANPLPGAPGSGYVDIAGSEGTSQVCTDPEPPAQPVCHNVPDSGSVSIQVGSYPAKSVTFGTGSTASSIASALASAFHSDASAPADAVVSPTLSSRIIFTARGIGAATNYTLSVGPGSDFWATPSGATLSGGRDPSSSPDAGSVTITVNGTPYQTTYGGSDTASSIATRLATAITAGSWANASASGGTVTITAKTTGPGGDYTLSSSSTYDSAHFAQPSFTPAPSASALSGGYDASAIDNQPFRTLYTYNGLGNLLRVDQKGTAPSDSSQWRTRTFTYDSLSRLLTANNPESGTITYSYDLDGNLLQKTSPAPNQTGTATQMVSYCYDALHRVTSKTYGALSPCSPFGPLGPADISYGYDSSANAIGHLTLLGDKAGTASYTYDILGRLATETRTIAGVSKSTGYSYNLDGSVRTLTYPSGRVVTYTPDSAGRLVSAVDGNGTNYVTSASYNPDSSLKSLLNGSTPALNQNFQYTPRLQLCRITTLTSGTLPTSCTDSQHIGNIMDRGYDFHAGNGTAGSGTDNGNIFAITNYRDANRSQAFTYDALNRLSSGWSSANTGAYSWGENYSIDSWGNLQTSPMGTKAHGGTFQLSGNVQNRPTGMTYDAAGNLMSYVSSTYTYDQENRLSSTAGMSYTYDGNGERVLKSNTSTGAAVKRYWSMGGNTLAEGDGSGNLTAEYVYFGGKRIARIDFPANSVHYYLSDHLGSTSIVASAAGAIEEESDYYPFGTEVPITGPGVNELKFTGKRRDTESQLDYFGARYYFSSLGRFVNPDWSAGPESVPYAHLYNPQSLNLYGYVRNTPEILIDADGHQAADVRRGDQCIICFQDDGPSKRPKNNGPGPIMFGFAWGHHGFPGWSKLLQNTDAYKFFSRWRTGPLENPEANLYDQLHRQYNKEVEKIVEDYLKKVGKSAVKDLTQEESKQLARQITSSESPGIQTFLQRLGSSAISTLNGLIDRIEISIVPPVPKVLIQKILCDSGACSGPSGG